MYVTKPTRIHALEIGLAWQKKGVYERGGNNRGPLVELIQRSDTLTAPDIGYAWCQSTMNAFWRLATGGVVKLDRISGGQMLLGGSASVGVAASEAYRRGYGVKRPLRGDHFALNLDGDSWPDHTGQVIRVLNLGPLGYLCRTLEGNTSGGEAGSQDDGGGLYVRTRRLSNRTIFYRVPGTVRLLAPMTPAQRRTKLRAQIVAFRKKGMSWDRIKATPEWAWFRKLGGK